MQGVIQSNQLVVCGVHHCNLRVTYKHLFTSRTTYNARCRRRETLSWPRSADSATISIVMVYSASATEYQSILHCDLTAATLSRPCRDQLILPANARPLHSLPRGTASLHRAAGTSPTSVVYKQYSHSTVNSYFTELSFLNDYSLQDAEWSWTKWKPNQRTVSRLFKYHPATSICFLVCAGISSPSGTI